MYLFCEKCIVMHIKWVYEMCFHIGSLPDYPTESRTINDILIKVTGVIINPCPHFGDSSSLILSLINSYWVTNEILQTGKLAGPALAQCRGDNTAPNEGTMFAQPTSLSGMENTKALSYLS